jgi:hypothetical protein
MIQQSLFDRALDSHCPRCGSPAYLSLDELSESYVDANGQVQPDMAEWLTSPQNPVRPISVRRRIATRNSISFGLALVTALAVACFALTGSIPSFPVAIPILALGCTLSYRTWRTESTLAREEEALQLDTYWELYRAYLNREQVWSRLRYCTNCSIVLDPETRLARPLFELHELANRRPVGAGLR